MRVAGQSEKKRCVPALLPDPSQRVAGRAKALGPRPHCTRRGGGALVPPPVPTPQGALRKRRQEAGLRGEPPPGAGL